VRYFTLSRTGAPLAWMLYLGVPITAAGILLALQLIDLGAGWTTKTLDLRRDNGADMEHSARRLQIISDL
jgi:hypothetical protein